MTVSLDSMSIGSGFHSSVWIHFVCLNLVRAQGVSNSSLNFKIMRENRVLAAAVVLYGQSASLQACTSFKANDKRGGSLS